MRNIPIGFVATLTVICFLLIGCARPPVPTTPQSTEPVTSASALPHSAETLAIPSPVTISLTSAAPALRPSGTPTFTLVSIGDVVGNPEAFRDLRVHIRGYGLIAATLPLCQGYVGLDRRTNFVDAAGDKMVADVKWQPPPNARMYDPDNLRTFEGYIRVFRGEIGCPGEVTFETFPYFEVMNVAE